MRNFFAKQLLDRAHSDNRIQLIAEDLGFGVLDEYALRLPGQYMNIGITEQATMSIVAGMAFKGLRPFVYSIANFPTFRCLEQIRNDVNAMKLPVTIVAVGAGLGYGKAGYSHYAVEDISAIRSLSNITIYNPSNAKELDLSLRSILANDEPSYLRIGGKIIESTNSSDSLMSHDFDLHIVYSGDVAPIADEASKLLRERNINVSLVSMWNLSPSSFDQLLLQNPKKIITLEEHVLAGGFSSMLLERISDAGLDIKVKRVGISRINPDLVGSQDFLRLEYGVTSSEIVKRAISLLND